MAQKARFSVGIAPFPQPGRGEGHWGEFSGGWVSEAEGGMECILGISATAAIRRWRSIFSASSPATPAPEGSPR